MFFKWLKLWGWPSASRLWIGLLQHFLEPKLAWEHKHTNNLHCIYLCVCVWIWWGRCTQPQPHARRIACEKRFCPSMPVLGIELMLSGFAASPFAPLIHLSGTRLKPNVGCALAECLLWWPPAAPNVTMTRSAYQIVCLKRVLLKAAE